LTKKEVSKEMITTGDWFRPHYEDKLWVDKPPLLMWSTAVLFKEFGISEFWARAASVLTGAVVVVLTFVIAARLFDRPTGLISISILVTAFNFVKYERRGMPDVPLTMFILIAVYGYLRLTKGEPRQWYSILSAGALGAMVKSIAVLVAPAAMLAASVNDIPGLSRILRSRHLVPALCIAVLIAVPWHAFMVAQYGADWLSRYFGFHVGHALTIIDGNSGDQGYYLRSLANGMFPWVYLVPFALLLAAWQNVRTRQASLILLPLIVVARRASGADTDSDRA
jgi:4-amino-4-deoxy-L-arabinose transferase-like glycosyltransferase